MTQVTVGCMSCDWEKTVEQNEAKGNDWKDKLCDDGCNETLFYFVD